MPRRGRPRCLPRSRKAAEEAPPAATARARQQLVITAEPTCSVKTCATRFARWLQNCSISFSAKGDGLYSGEGPARRGPFGHISGGGLLDRNDLSVYDGCCRYEFVLDAIPAIFCSVRPYHRRMSTLRCTSRSIRLSRRGNNISKSNFNPALVQILPNL